MTESNKELKYQIANPEFEYDRARRELSEAMEKLKGFDGPGGSSAA